MEKLKDIGSNLMHKTRADLSKIKFALHLDTKIEQLPDYRAYIPEPFDAVLIFQADFELAWAWRYAKGVTNGCKDAEKRGMTERDNVPVILDLCEEYKIPVTWATVGHLFLRGCSKVDGIVHPEIIRLGKFENKYWQFQGNDWFDCDPCSDYLSAPSWYCPDLIELILESEADHEIGCHTFSHIDCREEICPPEVLESELRECKKLASAYGLELKSFVHPAHTIGNLKTLKKLGFTNFRTNYQNTLGYPKLHPEGIWELKSTIDLYWRDGWSANYHIQRYRKIIDRAIKYKSVCVIWFHPSLDKRFLNLVLPEIFKYIKDKKIQIITSGKYFDNLEKSKLGNY